MGEWGYESRNGPSTVLYYSVIEEREGSLKPVSKITYVGIPQKACLGFLTL